MISRELIQRVLGNSVTPRNLSVYNEALIHKSASKTYGISQERLEHLGDAVLQLCVTHMLFEKFPGENEGGLTRMRTRMVNGDTLASLGRSMGVDNGVIVDETAQHVFEHDRLYEDTFEALVGAVYLDLGLDNALQFVLTQYEKFADIDLLSADTNYKEILKKATTRRKMQAPKYTHKVDDGVYSCEVTIGDLVFGSGEGVTRKKAEMEAAHNAVEEHFSSGP